MIGASGFDELHRTPAPKVSSPLASSATMISSTRARKSAGMRSSVVANVLSALYATTRMPMRGEGDAPAPFMDRECRCHRLAVGRLPGPGAGRRETPAVHAATSTGEPPGIPTATVDTLVTTWRALSEVCSDLDEAGWKSASGLPGWTVQDVLSHIVGTERFLEGLEPAPPAGVTFAHVRNPIGGLNENEVEWRRRRAGDEVLTEWDVLREQRERTLAAGDAAYYARPMTTPTGPGTMADFLAVRILDCWLHEQDLRRALGRPGNLDGPAAEHTVDRLVRTLPIVVGKRAACPEGAAVTIAITGAVERTVHVEVHDGRAAIVDAPTGPPLATVTMPTEAFVLLATGRAVSDEQADGVTVDAATPDGAAVGRAVVERLNMMI